MAHKNRRTAYGRGWHGESGRHFLAQAGIETAGGKQMSRGRNDRNRLEEYLGRNVSDDEIEKKMKDILPDENEWYNFGDVNFDAFGGVVAKRDDGWLYIHDVTPVAERGGYREALEIAEKNNILSDIKEEYDLPEDMDDRDWEDFFAVEYAGPYYVESYSHIEISDLKEELQDEYAYTYSQGPDDLDLEGVLRYFITGVPFETHGRRERPMVEKPSEHYNLED